MLKYQPELYDKWKNNRDIADSYLQAVYWLNNN